MSKSALGVRGTVRPVPPVLPFPRVPFARLRGSFLHEPLALSRLFHSHQQLLYQLEHRWSSLQIQNEHVHKSYCRCFYGWQMSSVGRGIPTRTTKLLMKQKTCDMQSAPVILLRDSPSSQSKHKIKYAATLVGVIFCHRLRIFFNDTINASLMNYHDWYYAKARQSGTFPRYIKTNQRHRGMCGMCGCFFFWPSFAFFSTIVSVSQMPAPEYYSVLQTAERLPIRCSSETAYTVGVFTRSNTKLLMSTSRFYGKCCLLA